ncbi:hypothetical protein OH76DRAFT_1220904 [Lentinus brumalis]|uniref:Uncharacterized protein n=1 Tax=Lentinus brumalis TaxID=2498619 RepID=A0A371DLP0_9APHY|nr:hypothetical protein OH76DRAFT_1220904 [Polyporus brumalis]
MYAPSRSSRIADSNAYAYLVRPPIPHPIPPVACVRPRPSAPELASPGHRPICMPDKPAPQVMRSRRKPSRTQPGPAHPLVRNACCSRYERTGDCSDSARSAQATRLRPRPPTPGHAIITGRTSGMWVQGASTRVRASRGGQNKRHVQYQVVSTSLCLSRGSRDARCSTMQARPWPIAFGLRELLQQVPCRRREHGQRQCHGTYRHEAGSSALACFVAGRVGDALSSNRRYRLCPVWLYSSTCGLKEAASLKSQGRGRSRSTNKGTRHANHEDQCRSSTRDRLVLGEDGCFRRGSNSI